MPLDRMQILKLLDNILYNSASSEQWSEQKTNSCTILASQTATVEVEGLLTLQVETLIRTYL